MNEAKILEMKARIAACEISAAGMIADNTRREHRGEALAWGGAEFFSVCDELGEYADQLAALAKSPGGSNEIEQ